VKILKSLSRRTIVIEAKTDVMRSLHYSISKRDIILSCLSGVLLILLFPKFNLEFLAWVALVPLFMAVNGKDHAQAFGLAWMTGIVYFSGVLYWVVNTMIDYGHLSRPTSYLILFMLVVYLSFYVALFGFFLGHLDKSGYRKWFVAPFLWTSLEYLRAHVFTGFPWAALGYSQFRNLRIIQIADITGVYGLTFLIVLVNVLFFLLLESIFKKDVLMTKMKGGLPSRRILLVLLFLCFSLPLFYGSLRIKAYHEQTGQRQDSLEVALVQGNIEQDRKWDPEYVRQTLDIYKELTLQTSENHPKLIVSGDIGPGEGDESLDTLRQPCVSICKRENKIV
jgi:apolipoprotein N-acyltransferase